MDVDTSEFRVWQCDKAVVAKPSLDALAMNAGSLPCETIDHGVWLPLKAHGQALWLGKTLGDVLLLEPQPAGIVISAPDECGDLRARRASTESHLFQLHEGVIEQVAEALDTGAAQPGECERGLCQRSGLWLRLRRF